MPVEDDKFFKIMRMVGSDNDNEALQAIKSLKESLSKSGKNWNWFVNALEKVFKMFGGWA